MRIEDGSGIGRYAKVDSQLRLNTFSITEDEKINAVFDGRAYNINTGYIANVSTANTALLYFKNNESSDFNIESIAFGMGSGITHSDQPFLTVIKNPTTGTIISGATNVDMNQNRNFGSSLTLSDSLAYKGANGNTFTNGTDVGILQVTSAGRSFFSLDLVLPKSSSIGIKITPNASLGNADMYVAIIGYLLETLT